MLTGSVTTEFLPFIYGAYLIVISKKDGGIRPIAVGSTFRRLVSNLCYKQIEEVLLSSFKLKQYECLVKGGGEAAVHAVRTYLNNSFDGEVIVKDDVKNAFNSRSHVRESERENFADLSIPITM
ncbi:hypothetical protein ILUMI_19809 [Ignelater luminosus]|uniref:Uncharacterized protein n=1 Tax=Ignelater luminosus TaxID=2038154 RepID=A0A8K0FZI8_IGNLU|nr:hypothetical protein ILUMI_19809 [Ignelater luminosus]